MMWSMECIVKFEGWLLLEGTSAHVVNIHVITGVSVARIVGVTVCTRFFFFVRDQIGATQANMF